MSAPSVSADPDLALRSILVDEVRRGLGQRPLSLSPWLFYDERGSDLFEQITRLPEYYLTRTERALFQRHAAEIVELASNGRELSVAELGAGTAAKSGVILRALAQRQGSAIYQPIDVSVSALVEAERSLAAVAPTIAVESHVADYTAGPLTLRRPTGCRLLTLYIGSSIGNFEPAAARAVLRHLRSALEPGDTLLLGTDLAPGANKSVETLRSAYDDAAGVTAAFNLNVLARLNRDLDMHFDLASFRHRARWNAAESRIEMHLEALRPQQITLPGEPGDAPDVIDMHQGETIHTENSYKFDLPAVDSLLRDSGFQRSAGWQDDEALFAVTLAVAQ